MADTDSLVVKMAVEIISLKKEMIKMQLEINKLKKDK
tara:strand:+ start:1201 stop:1311 length:111 start_codon:yes stop_codon:yes gene_type:complete